MSYQMKIDGKSRTSARFISDLQKKIQAALVKSGKSQQEVAEKIGVDRSVVNRRLRGGANLTARSISEFAYAFGMDVKIEFVDRQPEEQVNWTHTSGPIVGHLSSSKDGAHGTVAPQSMYVVERTGS